MIQVKCKFGLDKDQPACKQSKIFLKNLSTMAATYCLERSVNHTRLTSLCFDNKSSKTTR